jgi:hypothetical protein
MGDQAWAEAFKAAHGYYPWDDPELKSKGLSQQQALNEHLAAKKASEQPNFQGWDESYDQRHPAQVQKPVTTQPVYPPIDPPDVPLPKPMALYNPYGYAEANKPGGSWSYAGPEPSSSDPHSLTWQAPFDPNSQWWKWKSGGVSNPAWAEDPSLFNPYRRDASQPSDGTWVYKGPRPPRNDPNYQTWKPVFDPGSQWWQFVEGSTGGETDGGTSGVPDIPRWAYR